MTPTAGLTTTEAGGTATFTVVLNTQPTADVTIALSSSDTTEGHGRPASLIFTTANWNVAQTVTVTGVNDALVDGDIALHDRDGGGGEHRRRTTAALNAADVAVTQHRQRRRGDHGDADAGPDDDRSGRDGDVHGRAEHAADGGRDDRADARATPTEGTVSPASLIFTTANWNMAQTVTVTGVDDAVVDGHSRLHDRDGAGGEHRPELQRRRTPPTWR